MAEFDDTIAYLAALEADPDLAVLSMQMTADALGVGRGAIVNRINAGSLEAIKIGRVRYVLAGSVINILSERKAEVATVKLFLEEIASLGFSTTYAPVMGKIDRSTTIPNDRSIIGRILGEISRESYEEHGFLLSALVNNSALGKPSESFFLLAGDLDPSYDDADTDEDYLAAQLRLIHAHYG